MINQIHLNAGDQKKYTDPNRGCDPAAILKRQLAILIHICLFETDRQKNIGDIFKYLSNETDVIKTT